MNQRPTRVLESLLAIALAGFLLSWVSGSVVPGLVGVILSVLGQWWPGFALMLDSGWMGLALILGRISQFILLACIYFLVLTPIGVAARILGRTDKLRLRKPTSASNYTNRTPNEEGHAFLKPW